MGRKDYRFGIFPSKGLRLWDVRTTDLGFSYPIDVVLLEVLYGWRY
jgi:hypothetical protein